MRLVAEGAFWHEVLLLAVGRLVHLNGETARPLELIAELCPARPGETEVARRQAWLAAVGLLEMGLNRVCDNALGRELAERARHRMVELLRATHLSPATRAAAGNVLAFLGDPRFRADAWYLPDESLLGFVEIPAGPFRMGSDWKCDPLAEDEEGPQHAITLPRYYISRYPVTVAQFQSFIEESGHKPANEASMRGLSNRPVARVTWNEALEYCNCLTARLREWEGTPKPLATLLRRKDWRIVLPSEAEWEKAARGTDGRIYPWGNEADPNRANYRDTHIGERLSAVGCFPDGASPYGVEEMSGGVWEWTRSLWGDYPYPTSIGGQAGRENLMVRDEKNRVLRGGSCWVSQVGVRCAFRLLSGADYPWEWRPGFRVVLRPCR